MHKNKYGVSPSYIINHTGKGMCVNLTGLEIGGFKVIKPCKPAQEIKKRTQWWQCECEYCGHMQAFRSDTLTKGWSGKCEECSSEW